MQGRAFIEGEHDVCAQFMLNLHRNFCGKAMHRTVKVALKGHALIINMGKSLFILSDDLIRAKGLRIHGENLFKANSER